jgi:hypothetical protein
MADEEPDLAFDGGRPWSRKQTLLQLNERLKMEPGVGYTRFEPSRITPDTVITSLTPREFLGEAYPAVAATLAVWWSPRSTGKDHFTIQWYETRDAADEAGGAKGSDPTLPSGYTLSCGWHQDDHFDELGEAHFQEEYPDGTVERYGVTFDDATPRWILSENLRELPDRLATFRERLDAVPESS